MPLTWKSLGCRHTWAGPAPGGTTAVPIHLQRAGEKSSGGWSKNMQIWPKRCFGVFGVQQPNASPSSSYQWWEIYPTVGLFGREGQHFHMGCAELRVCGWMGVPNNKDLSKQAGEDSWYSPRAVAKVGGARGSDVSFALLRIFRASHWGQKHVSCGRVVCFFSLIVADCQKIWHTGSVFH